MIPQSPPQAAAMSEKPFATAIPISTLRLHVLYKNTGAPCQTMDKDTCFLREDDNKAHPCLCF